MLNSLFFLFFSFFFPLLYYPIPPFTTANHYSRTRSHTHTHTQTHTHTHACIYSPRVSVLSFFVSPLLTHGKQNIPHAHSFFYHTTTTTAAAAAAAASSFAAALAFGFPSVCDWHSPTFSTPFSISLRFLTTTHFGSRVCTRRCAYVCVRQASKQWNCFASAHHSFSLSSTVLPP